MTYKEEFLTQWKNYISIVESAVIKQIKVDHKVSVEAINQVIAAEKDKWLSSAHYQGIWLRKINTINSSVGKGMESILKGISICDVQAVSGPSVVPYVLIAGLMGVGSYLLTSYLKLASWQIWGASIITTLFIGSTLMAFWKEKNIKLQMKHRGLYLSQLNKPKEELIRLCDQLDSKNRSIH